MERKSLYTIPAAAMLALSLVIVLGVLNSAGCKSGSPLLEVESPQAVLSPFMLGTGSAFLTIVNKGNGDDTLVAARVDIPGTITELHDVLDGKMKKIEKIQIPARTSVRLQPGSLHIMIFNMSRTTDAGQSLTLVLSFEKSGEKRVPVTLTSKVEAVHEHHH